MGFYKKRKTVSIVAEKHIKLVLQKCGRQTTVQIFQRISQNESLFYSWLDENPNATKQEIRRKSHEIAGTLEEYFATENKRFYVLQSYRNDVKKQSCENSSCSKEMILGANLQFAALEIAQEMPRFSAAPKSDILMYHYLCNVLQEYGISWEQNEMLTADVSQMDAEGIIALIFGTAWANRLHPGLLTPYLECGTILRWLDRLDELD